MQNGAPSGAPFFLVCLIGRTFFIRQPFFSHRSALGSMFLQKRFHPIHIALCLNDKACVSARNMENFCIQLSEQLRKGAEVYIADFKGGVDFPKVWHEKCRMCFTEADLLITLNQLVAVLEYRKGRLAETGCPDLDAYNEATGDNLPRLVFACDEVAEVLDKTGADAERKKLLAQIESKLATIARLGRAFGIHLILATQRPDATIIPGQIKNNLDFRVCGRAENTLSLIILDNGSAAEQIPKDARGRFITGDGTVFQAYWMDERKL